MTTAAALLLAVGVLAQQDERGRESLESVPDILAALSARNGAHLADLGSADGFYTLRIANAVAPSGRAYAVDIDERALDKLRERAKANAIANIQIILSALADPSSWPQPLTP